eukprot:2946322-Rhodomonas_salina.1
MLPRPLRDIPIGKGRQNSELHDKSPCLELTSGGEPVCDRDCWRPRRAHAHPRSPHRSLTLPGFAVCGFEGLRVFRVWVCGVWGVWGCGVVGAVGLVLWGLLCRGRRGKGCGQKVSGSRHMHASGVQPHTSCPKPTHQARFTFTQTPPPLDVQRDITSPQLAD